MFSFTLPPLRERRGDILPLATYFLIKHAHGAAPPHLSPAAADALLEFGWQGNVRELESTIVRAVHLAQGDVVEAADLGLPAGTAVVSTAATVFDISRSYKIQKRQVLDAFERQYLVRLMKAHHGNVSRAARAAGKERRDLGKLLKRHGLDPRRFGTRPPADDRTRAAG